MKEPIMELDLNKLRELHLVYSAGSVMNDNNRPPDSCSAFFGWIKRQAEDYEEYSKDEYLKENAKLYCKLI